MSTHPKTSSDLNALLGEIQRNPVVKAAKFSIIQKSRRAHCTKLLLAFGQMHAVPSGKPSKSLAKKIAAVQHWLYQAGSELISEYGIRSMGAEGLSGVSNDLIHMRLTDASIDALRRELQKYPSAKDYFFHSGVEWRKALLGGSSTMIAKAMQKLDALSLLQSQFPGFSVFAIEQKDVHGRIGEGMEYLQIEINALEQSPQYKTAVAKSGKGLTEQEYRAAKQHGELVRAYNAFLTHPDRERSILREVLEHTEIEPITAFVLGNGHQKPFIRLAREFLPEDTILVWITPPQLRRFPWKAVVWIGCITALVLSGLLLYFSL